MNKEDLISVGEKILDAHPDVEMWIRNESDFTSTVWQLTAVLGMAELDVIVDSTNNSKHDFFDYVFYHGKFNNYVNNGAAYTKKELMQEILSFLEECSVGLVK